MDSDGSRTPAPDTEVGIGEFDELDVRWMPVACAAALVVDDDDNVKDDEAGRLKSINVNADLRQKGRRREFGFPDGVLL